MAQAHDGSHCFVCRVDVSSKLFMTRLLASLIAIPMIRLYIYMLIASEHVSIGI